VNIGNSGARLFLVTHAHWFLLVLLAVLISIGIHTGEFHYFGDEMRHAVTGLYFRDLLMDLPLSNPVRYTLEYYAKYPALGLLYWPPFFHFVEGIFFLVFGISVVSSRLSILAFALAGAYFWYRIAERQGSRHLAFFSALIFPLLPFVLTYERVTMLEIPMVAMCLAAIHFWLRFIDGERAWDLWLCAFFVAVAMLTSQKSIFLALLIPLHFLGKWRWRLLKRWDVWCAAGLSAALVLPWYFFTFNQLALSYERVVGEGFSHAARVFHALYYLKHLPDQVGLLFTCVGGAGVLWALMRARRRYGLFLLWVFSTYVCYTLIQEKSIRHTMIWIPVLVYFALVAVDILLPFRKLNLWAAGAIAAYYVGNAVVFEVPKISGVEEVAKYVLSQPESDILYYQGALNGNFIFMVRKHDAEKRRLVAREKQVVAIRVFEGYGSRRIMESEEEFLDFVRNSHIRYVILENREHLSGLNPVRAVVNSDHFELLRIFDLTGNEHHLKERRVLVYRLRDPFSPQPARMVIPMMTIREDIPADLSRLAGRPWPN
jgi:hypothetical protein